MTKRIQLIISLLFASTAMYTQPCLPEGIYFSTQAQIDSFPINYPNCTEIEGTVTISGPDITDLRFLNTITNIDGSLNILDNDNLTTLDGLENITDVGGWLRIGNHDEWPWGNNALKSISSLVSLKRVGGGCIIGNNSTLTSLEGLDSLELIGGDLTIVNNPLKDLSGLGSLDSINGDLEITFNPSLKTFNGVEELLYIGGYFEATYNDSLLNMTGMENIVNIPMHMVVIGNQQLNDLSGLDNLVQVQGGFIVRLNPALISFNGLHSLTSIGGSMQVMENNSLPNLGGLENLVTVGTEIIIEDNALMTDLQGMMNLKSAHEIRIKYNPSLKTINSFGSLEKLTGKLYIMYNDSLVDLAGFNQLDTIMGQLLIRINPSLLSLNGLDNLTYVGDLVSIWAEKINTLEALSNLHYIGDGLDIEHTDSLRTLEGLEGLYGIKGLSGNNGGLCLIDNAALEDISALSNITSLKWIYIHENHVLESLTGLDHINPNGISHLIIENNDMLSECEVLSICQYLMDGGDNTIINNETGCNTVDEVIEACEWVNVSEEPVYDEITIEPNPTESIITVRFRGQGSGYRELSVFDLSGRLVDRVSVEENEFTYDASHLREGLYLLNMKMGRESITTKLLKK